MGLESKSEVFAVEIAGQSGSYGTAGDDTGYRCAASAYPQFLHQLAGHNLRVRRNPRIRWISDTARGFSRCANHARTLRLPELTVASNQLATIHGTIRQLTRIVIVSGFWNSTGHAPQRPPPIQVHPLTNHFPNELFLYSGCAELTALRDNSRSTGFIGRPLSSIRPKPPGRLRLDAENDSNRGALSAVQWGVTHVRRTRTVCDPLGRKS